MNIQKHPKFKEACKAVAKDWEDLANAIFIQDDYAGHVTDQTKKSNRLKMIAEAKDIATGNVKNFTIWQRVNEKITGECVPLFKK